MTSSDEKEMGATRFPFTRPKLLKLAPREKRFWVYDTEVRRLAAMVTPEGARVFYAILKVRGQTERIRLGLVKDLPVGDARKAALAVVGGVALGGNPVEERRKAREVAHAAREATFGDIWNLYLEQHAKVHKRDWKKDEARYNRFLTPWASRPASSITRSEVAVLHATITKERGGGQANRVRALLHTIFEKGRLFGVEIVNPVTGTPRNPEHTKERYLFADELSRFLKAVEDTDTETRDFLKLLLFTGVRRGSLCAARWQDISLEDAMWTIPAENMKAGRSLAVPLAPAAVKILKERRSEAPGESPYVFPGRPGEHAAGPRGTWDTLRESLGLSGVTQHDLRRTFATYALEAGVPWPVIQRALGHTPVGGITAVYARVTPAQVRAGVERAVSHLLAVAAAKKGEAPVLAFPTPTAENG
jgi:integrase